MTDVPQFAIPPRIVDGQLATVEQGTVDELAARVNLLCHTPPGWLDSWPKFGLADQAFRKGGADGAYVAGQIQTWVPDASTVVEENPTLLDAGLDFLGLRVAAR